MPFKISNISPTIEAWTQLQASSPYASPFQSPEYYAFLLSQPNHLPLILTVGSMETGLNDLLALILIDLQNNHLRRLTSRAIVLGGPLISPDCPYEALRQLMKESINLSRQNNAVYFEIRSFFDYSRYSDVFSSLDMRFIDHGDCLADTSSIEVIDHNIQPRKLTQIRSALRHGITFIDNPTDAQITDFYALLRVKHWQRTRRPIPPLQYFLDLAHTPIASILLAYHNDALISGCVAMHGPIGDPQTTYYYYVAGENDLYRSLAPSSVITYHFLQYANKIGSLNASLMGAGRLSIPFGVRDFKVKMGGKTILTGRYLFLIHPLIYRLASFALNLLHRSDT
ncbi:MAG: GNAT family N-acetyltransferase [Bacteroidales bacterium]|nr:GNAT family N-acetyltransferase [Bacteroidales bacterium]